MNIKTCGFTLVALFAISLFGDDGLPVRGLLAIEVEDGVHEQGVPISRIYAFGPATTKLEVGDRLLRINGLPELPLETRIEVEQFLNRYIDDRKVTLEVKPWFGGQSYTVSISFMSHRTAHVQDLILRPGESNPIVKILTPPNTDVMMLSGNKPTQLPEEPGNPDIKLAAFPARPIGSFYSIGFWILPHGKRGMFRYAAFQYRSPNGKENFWDLRVQTP